MRINHNIAALNTYRQLTANNANGAKSLEKLSSGYRINRAGDDAAGLAISEKMRAQIRGLGMASKNSQDAISLIQTAEGALSETHSILQRMRELAVQSSNDTNVTIDRSQIQKEMNQLTSEMNRISNTTEFNTMKLLNGDRSITEIATAAVTSTTLNAGSKTVALIATYSITATNSANLLSAVSAVVTTTAAGSAQFVQLAVTGGGTITITKATSTSYTVNLASGSTGTLFTATDTLVANASGDFVYNDHGVSFTITAAEDATISASSSLAISGQLSSAAQTLSTVNDWQLNTGQVTLTSGITVTSDIDSKDVRTVKIVAKSAGGAVTVTLKGATGNTLFADQYSSVATILNYSNHGIAFDLNVTNATASSTVSAAISLTSLGTTTTTLSKSYDDKSVKFQVGANQSQSLSLDINSMKAASLNVSSTAGGSASVTYNGVTTTAYYVSTANVTDGTSSTSTEYSLDISTSTKAGAAITVLDNAVNLVSEERAKLGAVQNRLEHTIANLDASAENLQASESRIRDVDMAKEMMEFTKNNILMQAAQSMLAQANQQPQGVLQLLR